jgi:hypothetical protein
MINLQEEMKKLVGKEHWMWLIFRHLTDQQCNCVRKESGTADPECPNCQGAKWIFNEYLVKSMSFYTPRMVAHDQDFFYGASYSNIVSVYLPISPINEQVTLNDYFFTLKVKEDGTLYNPIRRYKKWLVTDSYDMRADGSNRQFMKIYLKPLVAE